MIRCKKFKKSKLVEEFRRISNFTCICLPCIYQTIVIGGVMKKMKIKIVKNMILYASSDFWLRLKKVLFKLENVISGINNDHL